MRLRVGTAIAALVSASCLQQNAAMPAMKTASRPAMTVSQPSNGETGLPCDLAPDREADDRFFRMSLEQFSAIPIAAGYYAGLGILVRTAAVEILVLTPDGLKLARRLQPAAKELRQGIARAHEYPYGAAPPADAALFEAPPGATETAGIDFELLLRETPRQVLVFTTSMGVKAHTELSPDKWTKAALSFVTKFEIDGILEVDGWPSPVFVTRASCDDFVLTTFLAKGRIARMTISPEPKNFVGCTQ
jgi:hypothetical protein